MVGIMILATCTISINAASKKTNSKITSIKAFVGNYVTPEYFKRNKGYDWVAVSITEINQNTAHIRIRSRIDKKKATCTFDSDAKLVGSRLISEYDGINILYTFTKKGVTIRTEKETDSSRLNFFCSGGGTIAGNYQKLSSALDKKQLDNRDYVNYLNMGNYFFEVTAAGKKLTIQPVGLEIDNRAVTHNIDGKVTFSEIDDLNEDGFPEILVYTVSSGKEKKGNIIAYSVNNGKSISQVSMPNLTDDKVMSKGYRGQNEYRVIEGNLYQRFPIFEQNGSIYKATGKYKQIKYLMKDGESSRVFVAVSNTEF